MRKLSQLPPPVHSGRPTFASRSTSRTATPLSTARACAPAATATLPTPGATLQLAGVSSRVHGPPVSAVPHPPVTVRLKLSAATTGPGGGGELVVVANVWSDPNWVPDALLATSRK